MKLKRGLNCVTCRLAVMLLVIGHLSQASGQQSQTILPAASLPASMPWELDKLSQAAEFSWAEGDQIRSLYFAGESYQDSKTRVFAYYASPDTLSGGQPSGEKYPAIVLVHGGGGTAFPQWVKLWAERGYAAIAMDLAGCGPDGERLTDGGPDQGHDMKFETIDLPLNEQWTYHAVANVIRAHSLIRSFPEVDTAKTAVTGISWGGYLTCIVAGLDNRFQAAVPVYGCGFLQDNSCWLNDFANMSPEQRTKWGDLWDPSQYVGSASMPMLFVNGGKDSAYPPDSHAKTFALVNSPKYLHFVPDLAHGHIFDRPPTIELFIAHYLKGGEPLAIVANVRIEGAMACADVQSDTALVEANLHYTEDQLSGDVSQRTWTTMEATIEDGLMGAEVPPDSATAWFFSLQDERGAVVSSPLVIPSKKEPAK
jgi:dienelactone hydrolase